MADVLTVTGIDRVTERLTALAREYPAAAAQALNEIAEATMTVAKERTPVDTGVLRGSGKVSAHATAADPSATLTYGTEYAAAVHENLRARHTVGEAKFLESAVNDAARTLGEDVAKGIREITGL